MELSNYEFSELRKGELTLYRGSGDGLDPILLVVPVGEYSSRESLKRFEHEYALRETLDADWAARPLALVPRDGRTTLVLEDPGGEPLDRLLGRPLDVAAFLHIAIPLAAALGQVHARGLIHKDVKPANILVDAVTGGVWLTGFGIASQLPREHQALAPPEVIAGTLAYMAPEQTGRMNRSVDSRSDLYSLGVTFFEMLTGSRPFTASDPMEWVHCHIARQPPSPEERIPNIPGQLSAIVLKLLAKTAEDRYQTAGGLAVDLRRCLADWESSGHIESFSLGSQDASDRLLIHEKLYGREREIDVLLSAFDRVVVTGTPELVLVSGYSGIGKSSVVDQLHKALVPPRGLFASGRFDQYKRDIPYATLAQAFRSLVRPLLGRSEAELGRWRDALREALGPNGQLIVNLIPEIELVIGKQPPLSELAPQDAKNRFRMLFRRFVAVFARREHPLVLFLDDLQWLDAATLELLEHLITHPEVRHLLLVGAYRDNEVGPSHPLMRTLEAIRKSGATIDEIVLAPLSLDDVGRLVADALHCEPERALPLAQLVHEKTGGNPFFAIQFFTALADEGLLAFDPVAPGWQWDMNRIRAKSYTDNVVELMAGKLKRFSSTTQEALKQLACLGSVVDIATLTLVLGETEEAIDAALLEAVHAGLVLQHEHAYRFLHDRIQQAAYSLIPEEHRAGVHLRIGRVLLAGITADLLAEHAFEIVNQLNRGAALIDSLTERAKVANLNLIAGRRARAATAYVSALNYFAAGAALLAEEDWTRHDPLTFALEFHRAECEFLTGDLAAADGRLSTLSRRAPTPVDCAAVTCLRVVLYTTLDRPDRAIEVGLDYLRDAGIEWPDHPTAEALREECARIWAQLGNRPIEALIDLPLMHDPQQLAAMDVLTELITPAVSTDPYLEGLIVARMTNLSLEHGNSDASCFAYVHLALVLGAHFGDYRAGFRFGRLALDLVDTRGLDGFKGRVFKQFGAHVNPWSRHVDTGRALVRHAFDVALARGDLTFAAYSCNAMISIMLASGDPLADVQRESEHGIAFTRNIGLGRVIDILTTQLALVHTLRGVTPRFGTFDDGDVDERRFEERLDQDRRLVIPACWYWIRKLQARVLAGDYASALDAAERARPILWVTTPFLEVAEYHFFAALARAATYDIVPTDQRLAHLEALATHHRQLEVWSQYSPENFDNRTALVGAEIARIEGRDLDAMRFYEEAIRSSRANHFVHHEALGNELASRFYAARGFQKIAHVYLQDARHCYLRWGADGKTRQLERLHPELREEVTAPSATATMGAPVRQLDVETVVKASQALSSEIVLNKLIEKLMRIAVEHAGAERGLLILLRGNALQIEAEASTDRKTVDVKLRQDTVTANELPESLIHTVIRTSESVILDDASAENPFSADAYFRQTRARSVLCVPMMKQAMLIGVLYLENTLASHVFTPDRISVLELLSSQAAISLENARLYADLACENRERQTVEDALRVSEERWRNLVEGAPVGVALTDRHGHYVATNSALQRMMGYSETELRGRSAADITHEDDRTMTEALIVATAEGKPPTRVEKRYRHKDGSVVWAEVSGFPIPVAGNTPLLAGIVVDITDRKRAEEELRRSQAYLAEAQRVSRTGSFGWCVSTGEILWSAETFRIFQCDPMTKPSVELILRRTHPEDAVLLKETIECAANEGKDLDIEHRLLLPDGSVKHVHVVGHLQRDKSGELEYVGAVMDMTATRQGEQALRQAEADLAHVSRMTTMGELVASIAHEVNQPLGAIVTNGSACLRLLAREAPDLDKSRAVIGRMINDGMRASEVIKRIRDLLHKAHPEKALLNINETVQEVIALVSSDVLRSKVELRAELAADLPRITGDRIQLQQVILNLIINGRDAMSDVQTHPRELLITSRKSKSGEVVVAVRDSGTGLDAKDAERIFDPFFTTKAEGMGLGLSISRRIIDDHGGRMWATANEDKGATIQFSLPPSTRSES